MKKALLLLIVLAFVLVPTALAAENVTVYYYNSEGWASVGVYTWEPSEQFGGWPGGACKDEGGGWWSIVVPEYSAGNHIIFNDQGAGSQTGDLVIEEGKTVFYGVKGGDEGTLTNAEAEAKFGALPGGGGSGGDAPAEAPKTGDTVIFLALGLLAFSAIGFVALRKKVKQ